MQPSKRVAVNTGILYARMAITVFISLYVTRLILSALGEEDFGIFNVIGGAIAMLTFLNTAMASASQRFMSYAQGEGKFIKQKQIFNVSILLHLIIAIILILVLEGIGFLLFKKVLKIPLDRLNVAMLIFQFMLASTFFTIISVPYDAVINAHENMLFVAVLGVFEAIVKLAIAIYVTYTSFDKLVIYGLLMALLSFLLLVLRGIYTHKKYKEVQINLKKYFSRNLFKEMTSFASWSLLSSSASIVTMQGTSIVLNSFFGLAINAAQGVANQISGQLMAFSNTMLKALNPVIVKSEGESNRNLMLKASLTGNKVSYFLLTFLSIPVILEMPFILNLWLKDVPDYAIIFCRLNLFRLTFSQLTVTFPTAIGATGKIKMSSIVDSIIWISLLPISFVMFHYGASPETIYINLFFMVIALAFSRTYFLRIIGGLSVNKFLRNVVGPCLTVSILSVIIAVIPMIFLEEGFIRLTIVLTIGTISFITSAYFIGFDKAEKNQIQLLLGRFLSKNISVRIKNNI